MPARMDVIIKQLATSCRQWPLQESVAAVLTPLMPRVRTKRLSRPVMCTT